VLWVQEGDRDGRIPCRAGQVWLLSALQLRSPCPIRIRLLVAGGRRPLPAITTSSLAKRVADCLPPQRPKLSSAMGKKKPGKIPNLMYEGEVRRLQPELVKL
jgi:hypothetical protein